MDDESHLRAIADSDYDESAIRAYADWLKSRDDPRAEFLAAELEWSSIRRRLKEIEINYFRARGHYADWLNEVYPLFVESPMVGRCHLSDRPGAPPLVQVGDWCTQETCVCIIEALHVYSEIPAETAGVIAEVLVAEGQIVEYGQPLFRLARPATVTW